MKGEWGCSKRSKRVHFYVDGVTLCGRASHLDFVSPNWDESDSSTCKTCRQMKYLFYKGLIPVKNISFNFLGNFGK